MKQYTLGELAQYVGGRVIGDPQLQIKDVQPFESAAAGDLTLALEKKYRADLKATDASAVIVGLDIHSGDKHLLQVSQPKVAFARLLALYRRKSSVPGGVSPQAHIGLNCRIADGVTIHAFVYVGDQTSINEGVTLFPGVYVGDRCTIGRDCTLHPNVVLYDGVSLGNRVVIHSGTVIGADGFGYVCDGDQQVKIPQTGTVIIHEDVEIGANSCVDRGTFGATILEKGVKLDNHVHIGHNCKVGENTVIVAQVGLSGSVEVGRNCVFAGHSGVVEGVKIGDHVRVTAKTAVTKDVPSNRMVSGHPAMEHHKWMKIQAILRGLPKLYQSRARKKTQ